MNYSTKTNHLLHLADNALIIGHRNSEWCGHGPILEQDIAITNIALDYIGQARNFYQYAAACINESDDTNMTNPATEDSLAYLRDVNDFKNHLITELPNGDWAQTILRIFLFSTYQYFLYQQLKNNDDAQLAAIAEKSLKEVTYHAQWSGDWVIRLGDGTDESKTRMVHAIEYIWPYTGELFTDGPAGIHEQWLQKVSSIFEEAGLAIPLNTWAQSGGMKGIHTEHLGYILAEMQFIQRAYPNSEW